MGTYGAQFRGVNILKRMSQYWVVNKALASDASLCLRPAWKLRPMLGSRNIDWIAAGRLNTSIPVSRRSTVWDRQQRRIFKLHTPSGRGTPEKSLQWTQPDHKPP